MNITNLIDEWETFRRRTQGIKAIISSLPPVTSDVIIKPDSNLGGISLSADGISQLWGGSSRVVASDNRLLMSAEYRIGLRTSIISLLCETLTVGNLAMSKLHIGSTNKTLASPGSMFDPNLQLIAGIANPDSGQYNVSLGSLIEPTSLMEDFIEVTEKDWSTLLLEKMKQNG